MLEGLFGGKNIEKILIFLAVNGTCYGGQLARRFKTPLTPIQQALLRLERGGVVESHYEGKTRLYQLSSTYPLRKELEGLLKKAYAVLPALEKGLYSTKIDVLFDYWQRLAQVNHLEFYASSQQATGWNGKGSAEVVALREGENRLIFQEKGSWEKSEGEQFDFSNVFRWTLSRSRGVISLEHLRRGANHPVFLFDLAIDGEGTLSSTKSYLCEQDTYLGQMTVGEEIRLDWRVSGPKKKEKISYIYSEKN